VLEKDNTWSAGPDCDIVTGEPTIASTDCPHFSRRVFLQLLTCVSTPRTLQYLMRHLANLAKHSPATSMHVKNLAIVWAPNLLRSKEIESVGFTGTDAFREVRIQSVVVEFLLSHVDILFSDKFSSAGKDSAGHSNLIRPKSILVPSQSTRLLTLEEAQARTLAQGGEGTGAVGHRFCSINLPADSRKRNVSKLRKSGGGSWKTFFTLGKVSGVSRRKSQPEVGDLFNIMEGDPGTRVETVTLRSAKSEESLSSHHSGLSKLHGLRRPRSSNDALSLSGQAPAISGFEPRASRESLASSEEQEAIYMAPDFHLKAEEWPDPEGLGLDPGCPDCQRGLSSPASDTASKPVSFTRKAANAFPHKGPRPPSLDISHPVAVTVPAKVLEMLGNRAGEAQDLACPGPPLPGPQPPEMISMLLQSCDFQLSRGCQREVQRKTAVTGLEVKGQAESPDLEDLLRMQDAQKPIFYHSLASLSISASHHVPPPTPPKDPARLMALALTERAHQVVRQASQQWQECCQLPPAPGDPSGGAYVGSLLIHLDQIPTQMASPLYSSVDPLKKVSPRDPSSPDSEIGHGYRSNNLTTQDSVLSAPPASLRLLDPSTPEASPETIVKLTQSLCGPISHCRVQRSAHPSPVPASLAPSNRQSQHCSVHWSNPQSPANGSPISAQTSSPSRRASGRSAVRGPSASAGLTLPAPPPPPPPKPPHLLHPCPSRCGTLPISPPDGAQPRALQLKPAVPPRPPVPQGQPKNLPPRQRPQIRAQMVPEASADRPQTRGPHRQACPPRQAPLLGPGCSTTRGPSPCPGRGEIFKQDNLYAEILPEAGHCQCSPHPAHLPEESPPALPYRPAPRVQPRFIAAPRASLPDPVLPQRTLLLRVPDAASHWAPTPGRSYVAINRQCARGASPAGSVPASQGDWAPHCRSPAGGRCPAPSRPYFQQGRFCYRHPEASEHEMATCPDQDVETSLRSFHTLTHRQVPEVTYVNVPVYPCRGRMSMGSMGRQQSHGRPIQAKSPRPEAAGPLGGLQESQPESSQPAPPIRPLAGRPAYYGYENVPAGLEEEEEEEEEEARSLEIAHLRSKSDPSQSERICVETNTRCNIQGRPGQGSKLSHLDRVVHTAASGLQKRQLPRKLHGQEWATEANWQSACTPFPQQNLPSGQAEFAASSHGTSQCYRRTYGVFPSGQLVLNSYRPGPDCGERGYCPSPGGYTSFVSEPEYEEAIVTYETGHEVQTLVYHGLGDARGLQGLGKASPVETGPYGAQYRNPLAPQRQEAPPHWPAPVEGSDRSFC
ncbi:rho GTPase-activating protein 33-like, partial [Heptranchias perlo]|uniref:rho GTPase-activating protein 33-like n=1 Tax=Heptranchias perlo TaxID=212740 RepID=UPI00355A3231